MNLDEQVTGKAKIEESTRTPWRSRPALVLRGVAFIPASFLTYCLLQLLVMLFSVWFYGNDYRLLIMSIFWGMPVWIALTAGLVGILGRSIASSVCPSETVGGIAFCTIIVLYGISVAVRLSLDSEIGWTPYIAALIVLIPSTIFACAWDG